MTEPLKENSSSNEIDIIRSITCQGYEDMDKMFGSANDTILYIMEENKKFMQDKKNFIEQLSIELKMKPLPDVSNILSEIHHINLRIAKNEDKRVDWCVKLHSILASAESKMINIRSKNPDFMEMKNTLKISMDQLAKFIDEKLLTV